MKRSVIGFICAATLVGLGMFTAASQTPQAAQDAPTKEKKAKKAANKGTEGWPYIKLHPAGREPYKPTDAEKQQIQAKIDQLTGMIRELKAKGTDDGLMADVEVYNEAAKWKLYYPEEFFANAKNPTKSVTDTLKALDTGIERANQLKAGKSPWTTQTGEVVRGYRSTIDGQVLPLRVTVPEEYDGVKPVPLDVAQHGRFTNLYEVETVTSWQGAEIEYLPHTLQIDLFGRGHNTYHWAAEGDIFDAIAFTKRAYKIDPERVMLRGFSMGGAGVWHTSLQYPDLWAAVEVGAGNTASHRIPVLDTLDPTYQAMCTLYDNMYEWAPNAYDIPFMSYVGEIDGNYPNHLKAQAEMEKAGIHFTGDKYLQKATDAPSITFYVAPNTPHEMSKDGRKYINAYLEERLKMGRQTPDRIRFLTYTTRYNRDYWVTLDGLDKHYERAVIDAKRSDNDSDYDITTKNLNRLVLRQTERATMINIDGEKLHVKGAPELALEKTGSTWKLASLHEKGLHKRHGMQGPIDDAFLEPFLVVRPTGTPWNAEANAEALRMLARFDKQFMMAYRGHIRIKDDKDVTADDFQQISRGALRRSGQQPLDRQAKRQAAAALDQRDGGVGQQELPRSGNASGADLSEPAEPESLCGAQ